MPTAQLPLRDIHVPDPVPWFPPAIGWWIVLIGLPLLLLAGIGLYKYLTRKTALKSARNLVRQLQQDTDKTPLQKLAELSALLRRVAISTDDRAKVAGLTGQAWLEYLDSRLSGQDFSAGVGQCLATAHYQQQPLENVDMTALFQLIDRWLKART